MQEERRRGGEEADLDWTPFFGNFIQVDPLKQQLHIKRKKFHCCMNDMKAMY